MTDSGYDLGSYTPDMMDPGLRTLLEAPISVKRGGIQYPKKGNAMKSDPQRDALAIAAAAKRLAGEALIAEADKIDKELAASRRPEPSGQGGMWRISVNFGRGGKDYEYLVLRCNGKYYTTGTGETAVFDSWAAFLRWLDENAVWHSPMRRLTVDNVANLALEASGQVPF